MIVAGVMKFSSNLLKCFAVSISIILCSVAGFQLSDDEISVLLMVDTWSSDCVHMAFCCEINTNMLVS